MLSQSLSPGLASGNHFDLTPSQQSEEPVLGVEYRKAPIPGFRTSQRADIASKMSPRRTSTQSVEFVYSDEEDDEEESDPESMIPNVRTFVRSEAPQGLVRSASNTNARGVSIDMTLHSHVSSGGGLLKGLISIRFNPKAKRNRTTQVSNIQLDCLGVESVRGHDPKMFFTVAQDILTNGIYLHDLIKTFLQEEHVKPGQCFVPFELQLPLDVGPGSFDAKDAMIEYSLIATIGLKNGRRFPNGKTLKTTRRVKLFPCLDPQRVLVPSQAPIDAVEEGRLRFGGKETLKVAARIHRPSWIAGQVAYVDVSATNDSSRNVHKIQLDLVRYLSFYKNAAASSAFQSVDHRLPEKILSKTVSTNSLTMNSDKSDHPGWKGIKAGCRETIVCQISVPANELTVSAGRFFESRYVIKVLVRTKGGDVQIELPITLIHINSLDVLPASAKDVSRMIATYAAPLIEQAPGTSPQASASSRRSSMPNLFGNVVLAPLREDPALLPVDPLSSRRNPDTHGSTPVRKISSNSKSATRRSVSGLDNTGGSPTNDLTSTKPGIQCDLRRALSLDYQNRFSKLDISAERASYTQGAPLARRSPDRKRRDLSENLAHRLHRERTKNSSFYDVV